MVNSLSNSMMVFSDSTWVISNRVWNNKYLIHGGFDFVFAQYQRTVSHTNMTKAYGLSYSGPTVNINEHHLTRTGTSFELTFDSSIGLNNLISLWNWNGIVRGYFRSKKSYGYFN